MKCRIKWTESTSGNCALSSILWSKLLTYEWPKERVKQMMFHIDNSPDWKQDVLKPFEPHLEKIIGLPAISELCLLKQIQLVFERFLLPGLISW